MAKIGIKGLTYAPYTSGGEGSSITYGSGVKLDDYMIRADLNEERADTGFYASSSSGSSLRKIPVTAELRRTAASARQATFTASPRKFSDSRESPKITAASTAKVTGAITYHAYWIYKAQFSRDGDSTTTKGENVEFQTESLAGNAVAVCLTSGGDNIYYSHLRGTTEAAARTWLNGKAGIS